MLKSGACGREICQIKSARAYKLFQSISFNWYLIERCEQTSAARFRKGLSGEGARPLMPAYSTQSTGVRVGQDTN